MEGNRTRGSFPAMRGEYKGKGLDFRAQPPLTKLCCVIHSSVSCRCLLLIYSPEELIL